MPALPVFLPSRLLSGKLNSAFSYLVLFAAILLPKSILAQNVNLGDDVARPIASAGHDYVGGLSETVNPANGNLSIKIDLPVPKGRGITLPFSITYNSGEVFRFYSLLPGCAGLTSTFCGTGPANPRVSNGWSDTFPYTTYVYSIVNVPPYDAYCNMSSSFSFYDPEGGAHMLGLAGISTIQNPSPYNQNPQCAYITYNDPSCAPNNTQQSGWWAGCSGGYTFDAIASGGDDQVHAQSGLCNGYAGSPAACGNGEPAFTVTDTSGTVYSFNQIFSPGNAGGLAYPTQVEDRNGNIIQVNSGPTLSMTDTLGRNVVSISSSGQNSTTYTVGGLNFVATMGSTGGANWPAISSTQVNTPPDWMNLACDASFSVNQSSVQGIQSLTLPNGHQYTFKYDPVFGLINEIDYPDGGWVKYTWKLSDTESELATFNALNNSGASPPFYGACIYRYQTPVVWTRTVGYGPNSPAAQTQYFAYSTTWNPSSLPTWGPLGSQQVENDPRVWTAKQTSETTIDNVRNLSSTTTYTYSGIFQPLQPNSQGQLPAELAVEQQIQYGDWNGKTLETVNKLWYDQFEIGSEQTALNNGQIVQTVSEYISGFPERLYEKDEYDFAASSPSRTTQYAYGFYSEPCRIVTYGGSIPANSSALTCTSGLPSGTVLSETDAVYDQGSLTAVDGLVSGTHDESQYGASGNAPRGNPTTVIRCLSGTGPGCTGPTTTYAFDETGQVVSKTDPCGNISCSDMNGSSHTTTYSYSDNFTGGGSPSGNTNAYLTKITYPTVNGVTPQESFTYNYTTSALLTAKDENGESTTYTYADPLNRLTKTSYADEGQTIVTYDDSIPSVTTSTRLTTSGVDETNVAVMDGLGHVIQTQLTSDPSGTDYVDTIYDGEGRVIQKSNSTRCSSSPGTMPTSCPESTWGVTAYSYDALGRTVAQQQPDGNALTWCYNNVASAMPAKVSPVCNAHVGSQPPDTWVDSMDENGNDWQRTSDAFGNLIEVMETNPISGALALETDYTYDSLRNLVGVSQQGNASGGDVARNRTFTYDSLSRLITSTNPETSKICYGVWSNGNCLNGYDANGNLKYKTDARGITTSYSYDNLNRLQSKTYSDGTSSSCYSYDTATNGVGHLGAEWTQTGACTTTSTPPSNPISLHSIVVYDELGRLKQDKRCTGAAHCSTSTYRPMAYNYDLAGHMTSYTDGIGARTFTIDYDSAGRLLNLKGGIGANPASLFSVQTYGALSWKNATISGLNATRTYDNRTRLTSETVTKP